MAAPQGAPEWLRPSTYITARFKPQVKMSESTREDLHQNTGSFALLYVVYRRHQHYYLQFPASYLCNKPCIFFIIRSIILINLLLSSVNIPVHTLIYAWWCHNEQHIAFKNKVYIHPPYFSFKFCPSLNFCILMLISAYLFSIF